MEIILNTHKSSEGVTKKIKINSDLRVILSLSLEGAKKSETDFIISTLENGLEGLDEVKDFEDLVKQTNKLLKNGDYDKEVDLVLLGLEDTTLHISQYGNVLVNIYRQKKLAPIVTETKKEKLHLNFISSGELKPGDELLVTHGLTNIPDLKETLNSHLNKNNTIDEALNELKESAHLHELGLYYTSIISFEPEEVYEEDELPESISPNKKGFATNMISNLKIPKFNFKFPRFNLPKISIPKIPGLNKTPKFGKPIEETEKKSFSKLFSNNKLIFIPIIVVLIFILIGSLYYSSVQREKQFEIARFQMLLNDTEKELEQAKRFVSTQNKVQAKQYIESVHNKATQIRDAGFFVADVSEILTDVNEQQEMLDNITYIKDAQFIYRTSGSNFEGIEVVDGELYGITRNTVIGPIFLSENQTPNSVEIPNNEIIVDTAPFAANKSMLVLTNTNNVYEIKNGIATLLNNTEKGESDFIEIGSFGSRNLVYLLAPKDNEIYGFSKVSNRLSRKQTYNNGNMELNSTISIGIDGNIYKLLNNGTIIRSYAKNPIDIDMIGGPTIPVNNLGTDSRMFTNENLRNIYVFDANKNRILVYRKEPFENTRRLIYERMYKSNDYTFQDFWVDNEETNLFFIDKENFYRYSLNSNTRL